MCDRIHHQYDRTKKKQERERHSSI